MKTIETVVTVDERGVAVLKMPPGITTGAHKVVVVIEETPKKRKDPLSFAAHDVGNWPFGPNETFRREDMYGDDGR